MENAAASTDNSAGSGCQCTLVVCLACWANSKASKHVLQASERAGLQEISLVSEKVGLQSFQQRPLGATRSPMTAN